MSNKLSHKEKKKIKEQKKRETEELLEKLRNDIDKLKKDKNNLPKVKEKYEIEIMDKANIFFEENAVFSLSEKVKQYNDIIEFTDKICSDIPEYASIQEIDSRSKEEACVDFYKSYDELKKQLKISENGINGERYTFNALKMLDYKIEILQNVNLYLCDEIIENDIIVITESGVFTLEVKYISKNNATITKQGLLGNKNVVEQSRKHIHALNRLLAETKYSDVPVYSILVFSNDKCTVNCYNNNVAVCYRNDVENTIFDECTYPKCLDKNEILEIKNLICQFSKEVPEIKYPLDINVNNYFSALSKYVSYFKTKEDTKNIEEEIERIENEIDKIDGPTVSQSLFIGATSLAIKYIFDKKFPN